jgi:hypothetical protein
MREEIIVVNKGLLLLGQKHGMKIEKRHINSRESIYALNITPSNSFASYSSNLHQSSLLDEVIKVKLYLVLE